jgi:DNA-binding LacI/PurR family transcriptional regulator
MKKSHKRVTIYDIAAELNVSASYISRALNDHPAISQKSRDKIKKKAAELNYIHNSLAANLRQGSSKIIGVIVPLIDHRFFSDAIAGIEEVCFEKNHSLIICQSHESFERECRAIDMLIHQNVDCILISVSAETQSVEHLKKVTKHNIQLIQFDRCLDQLDGPKVINNDKETAYQVSKLLIDQGYKRIAFLGGPGHLTTFRRRKEGFIQAIKEHNLSIPYNFIVENVLSSRNALDIADELLQLKEPPDAFLTVSDHQALRVLQLAKVKGIQVPETLGIFGFANEDFSSLVEPSISSVDQKSKEIGKQAAQLYFEHLKNKTSLDLPEEERFVNSEIILRQSSVKSDNRTL